MKIVIGITGATGTVYGVKLLEILKNENVETLLIMSDWAKKNLELETDYSLDYVESLADDVYENNNLGAKTSSGSFLTDGMIIMPCSMKTVSAIANGYDDNLISRTAGVMIKEGRKLILSPRETPLSQIHLKNMLELASMGVKIVPPMPAFYNKPETVNELISHHIMKVLDQFGVRYEKGKRWEGAS